jgi:hypothetical protein
VRWFWRLLASIAVALAIGSGGGAVVATDARASSPARGALFAPDSIWNAPVPADAPLDRRSALLSTLFAAEIARQRMLGTGPWIQTTEYSTPIYTVPRTQRRIRVILTVRSSYGSALRRAFGAVPLPANARPAPGSDGHLVVVQPSTDRLWEFWQLRRAAGTWRASWGGAMRGVSRSPGYFTRASWPGARRTWGATATSLPVAAGLIRIGELKRGRIDHALAIAIPDMRARLAAWPAQRTDGSLRRTNAIPAGAHFRIDPKIDVDALGLPPAARAIATAAQRYGLIVYDRTLHATGFAAEDPARTGSNPYPSLFGGLSPNVLLARFPWDHLQLLRMRLRAVP